MVHREARQEAEAVNKQPRIESRCEETGEGGRDTEGRWRHRRKQTKYNSLFLCAFAEPPVEFQHNFSDFYIILL